MGDLIYIAIVIGFFALTVLFVRACDAIIGPDPDLRPDTDAAPTDDAVELERSGARS